MRFQNDVASVNMYEAALVIKKFEDAHTREVLDVIYMEAIWYMIPKYFGDEDDDGEDVDMSDGGYGFHDSKDSQEHTPALDTESPEGTGPGDDDADDQGDEDHVILQNPNREFIFDRVRKDLIALVKAPMNGSTAYKQGTTTSGRKAQAQKRVAATQPTAGARPVTSLTFSRLLFSCCSVARQTDRLFQPGAQCCVLFRFRLLSAALSWLL